MADEHEALFNWPSTDPSEVILTGSFDQWAHTIHLEKTPSGFQGKVKVPWGASVPYKFIVDGEWRLDSHPTEPDRDGNINNIYTAPPNPATVNSSSEPDQSPTLPDNTKILSDGVTPTATVYISSGEADIEGVVDVEPINAQQITVTTTQKAENLSESTSAPDHAAPIQVAPVVPIGIVPVNAEVESAAKDVVLSEAEMPTTYTPRPPAAGAGLSLPAGSPALPPVAETSGSSSPTPDSKPIVNGDSVTPTKGTAARERTTTSVPSTPTKTKASTLPTQDETQTFPSSSPGTSPTSSKFTEGTTASRKKKRSIFGKIKHMFDKDEKEEETKKAHHHHHHH